MSIKVAILGTGLSLTAFHHPLLVALPELYTVHSVLERSGKETSRAIVGDKVKIVTTYEEIIGDAGVDLVVVSTPNRTHFDYVKRALEAGKHGKFTFPLLRPASFASTSTGWTLPAPMQGLPSSR
jgi:scyllo-inositol 2-dehydrogenase (NADP+)